MIDHRKQRRIIEWNWPGRLVELTEAWDGLEDRQVYLNRAATWNGVPIKPAEIDAQEVAYDAAAATTRANANAVAAEAEIDRSPALTGLIRLLIDPTFMAQGKTEQQVVAALRAKL